MQESRTALRGETMQMGSTRRRCYRSRKDTGGRRETPSSNLGQVLTLCSPPLQQMSASQQVQTFGKKKTATAVALARVRTPSPLRPPGTSD